MAKKATAPSGADETPAAEVASETPAAKVASTKVSRKSKATGSSIIIEKAIKSLWSHGKAHGFKGSKVEELSKKSYGSVIDGLINRLVGSSVKGKNKEGVVVIRAIPAASPEEITALILALKPARATIETNGDSWTPTDATALDNVINALKRTGGGGGGSKGPKSVSSSDLDSIFG